MSETFKIVITGPECTGKTDLATALGEHYKTKYVEEYCRQYLNERGGRYSYYDLVKMAKMQIEQESLFLSKEPRMAIFDTDLITFKIWSLERFDRVDEWILQEIERRQYDLYLLCHPKDIEWSYDPLRENPHDRDRLFDRYKEELQNLKKNFIIVEGNQEMRLKLSIRTITESMKH